MNIPGIQEIYQSHPGSRAIAESLRKDDSCRLHTTGLHGSALAMVAYAVHRLSHHIHLLITDDKERAAYLLNDLENIGGEREKPFEKRRILFFPTSYRRPYEIEQTDNANVLSRAEVLNKIMTWGKEMVIVTYPEALSEKVVTKKNLKKYTFSLRAGEEVSLDFLTDMLIEYGFERVDFVAEPGQFAIRGGIVDVFSFSHEYPFRIEFDGDTADSIRTFDPSSQLSLQRIGRIDLLPNIQDRLTGEMRQNLIDYLPANATVWVDNPAYLQEKLNHEFAKAREVFSSLKGPVQHRPPEELFVQADEFNRSMLQHNLVFTGKVAFPSVHEIAFDTRPQPHFNKNFELLVSNLQTNNQQQYHNYIFSDSSKQLERIGQIISDIPGAGKQNLAGFVPIAHALHEGFVDHQVRVACYTDHQIFDRYHRYRLRKGLPAKKRSPLKIYTA